LLNSGMADIWVVIVKTQKFGLIDLLAPVSV